MIINYRKKKLHNWWSRCKKAQMCYSKWKETDKVPSLSKQVMTRPTCAHVMKAQINKRPICKHQACLISGRAHNPDPFSTQSLGSSQRSQGVHSQPVIWNLILCAPPPLSRPLSALFSHYFLHHFNSKIELIENVYSRFPSDRWRSRSWTWLQTAYCKHGVHTRQTGSIKDKHD